MSELRDARLRRALQAAPDEHLRPDPRTRAAVRAAARRAVAPVPRWKKLWQRLGERQMPWNAALATVVLATLVTLLWRDRDMAADAPGGARSDRAAPAAPPGQVASAPAAQAAPPQAPVAGESPPQAAGAAPPPPARAAAAHKAAGPPAKTPAPGSGQAPERQVQAPAERRGAQDLRSARDQAAKSAAPAATAETPLQGEEVAVARAPAPAAPAAAAPAAAAPAMTQSAPPAPALQRRAAVNEEWTHLRIASAGRSFEIARERAPRLAELLEGMKHAAAGHEPMEGPAELRVELMRGREPAGVIELAGAQVRWTPGGAGDSFTTRPEPARLDALREEVGRLLRR